MNLTPADRVLVPVCDLVDVEGEMTATQLRALLERAGRDDPERAHGFVDDLMRAALQAISDGHPEPHLLAAAVLVAASADFPRWCA
jgi:hypothetical protein